MVMALDINYTIPIWMRHFKTASAVSGRIKRLWLFNSFANIFAPYSSIMHHIFVFSFGFICDESWNLIHLSEDPFANQMRQIRSDEHRPTSRIISQGKKETNLTLKPLVYIVHYGVCHCFITHQLQLSVKLVSFFSWADFFGIILKVN